MICIRNKIFKGAANIVALLFMAVLILGISGCGKDDEPGGGDNSEKNPLVQALVGTWTRSDRDVVGVHTFTITFNSNGTGTHEYFDVDEKRYVTDRFKWRLDGDYLTLSLVSAGGDGVGSWLNSTTLFPVDGDEMYLGGYFYKRS